jgi:hypothetical protein
MDYPAIIEKLNRELALPIESERQVVYILVETRKLLELTKKGPLYKTLRFYCNWAAHPILDKNDQVPAILQQFDKMVSGSQRIDTLTHSDIERNPNAMLECIKDLSGPSELIGFSVFKDELIKFLGGENVDCHPLEPNGSWFSFIRHYSAVIEDCPLIIQNNSTTFVKTLLLRKVPDMKLEHDMPLCLRYQWIWVRDDGTERTLVNATLAYPEEE